MEMKVKTQLAAVGRRLGFVIGWLLFPSSVFSGGTNAAAQASNALGIDLYRQISTGERNLCLSPYSIGQALFMAYEGATGETRREMSRVLHLGPAAGQDNAFTALQKSLLALGARTAEIVRESKANGGPTEPITIRVADRLFAQAGY